MTEEILEEPEVIKTDFYLKLANEDAMPSVLSSFYKQDTETTVDEETGEETTTNVGDPYLVPNTSDYAMDVVGTLHEPTGNTLTDDDGIEYPEIEALDTSHGVTPETPMRVWL